MKSIFFIFLFLGFGLLHAQTCQLISDASKEAKVLTEIKKFAIERIIRFRLQTCPSLKKLNFRKCEKNNLTYDKSLLESIRLHDYIHYQAEEYFSWNRLTSTKNLRAVLNEYAEHGYSPDTLFEIPYVYCTPSITVSKFKVVLREYQQAIKFLGHDIQPFSNLYVVHRKGPLKFYKEEDPYRVRNKDKYKNYSDTLDLSLCDDLYPDEEYFLVYKKDTINPSKNYLVGGMGDVIPEMANFWNVLIRHADGTAEPLAQVDSYMHLRLARLGDMSYAMDYRGVNYSAESKIDKRFPLYDTLNKLDKAVYFIPPYIPPRLWPQAYYLSGTNDDFRSSHPLNTNPYEFPIKASFVTNHPKLTGDRDTMNYYEVGYIIDSQVPICFDNYYEKYVKLQVFRRLNPVDVLILKSLFLPEGYKPPTRADNDVTPIRYDYVRGLFVEYSQNRDIK